MLVDNFLKPFFKNTIVFLFSLFFKQNIYVKYDIPNSTLIEILIDPQNYYVSKHLKSEIIRN